MSDESLPKWLERMTTMLKVVQEVPENPFKPSDRVEVNNTLPHLEGQKGTVRDTDYMGYVMVSLDDGGLFSVDPFLPEELKKVETE